MTEKEKAKAYDEAIERAKKLYGNGIIEEIFPELKESKDKKIREAILKGLIDCRDAPDLGWSNFGGIHIDDCIAWLEKQGDKDKLIQELGEYKVKYTQEVLEKYITSMSNKDDERLRKNCIHFLELQKQHHAATFEIEECIDWLEKQGEQKPTLPKWKYKKDNTPLLRDSIILNKYGGVAKSPSGAIVSDAWVLDYDELAKLPKEEKIEPKFKVGDWIISSVLGTARIIGVNDSNEFQLEYTDGKQEFSSIDYVNYAYDKWTIENGKDGNVLALSWLEDKNLWEKIIIFKKYHSEGIKGICSMSCVEGYGNTFKNGKLAFTDEEVPYHSKTWTWNLHPATKEQRDLLFQKIKEAGYEWDADKKELKKLDLVPNKKPILEGLKMKTYNDINIGDTVYIWGTSDSSVDETTITEKYDDRGHWNLKFSNGCVGRALKNGTSSTMGMYACLVYSDKEAVRESINERIKILSNIKI